MSGRASRKVKQNPWLIAQMKQTNHETRVERLLGAPLVDDAVRRWPQSGEILRGKARIATVESHFQALKLGVTRRHSCGNVIVVEWNSDYGDGRVYRNVSIGELRNGEIVRVTDYWGDHLLSQSGGVCGRTPTN